MVAFFYEYDFYSPHNIRLKYDHEGLSVFMAGLIVISLIALIAFSISLLEWIYIPEFKIVRYLTNMNA